MEKRDRDSMYIESGGMVGVINIFFGGGGPLWGIGGNGQFLNVLGAGK